jgi:glycerol-3-phosphate acyltransferase PlsY
VTHPALGILAAYLVGSIPAAYIAGRLGGVDLRDHGSGNLGATNVTRVLGWKVGLPVYLFDTAKGALPVMFLPGWLGVADSRGWALAYGVAAILGHVRPIFLLGRGGGKGVATAGGVFLALAPYATLVSLAVFIAALTATGYVSLGSLLAALALPVALLVLQGPRSPVFVASALIGLFVWYTHRANIGRLRRGEESRFGRRGRKAVDEAAPEAVAARPVGERRVNERSRP